MTILTSISEGQPLTILESFAAKIPVISTDVGCVRELIYGLNDGYREAGIVTHIMNVNEISQAMVTLANNEELRKKMGEHGFNRVNNLYRIEQMRNKYRDIYHEIAKELGIKFSGSVDENDFLTVVGDE